MPIELSVLLSRTCPIVKKQPKCPLPADIEMNMVMILRFLQPDRMIAMVPEQRLMTDDQIPAASLPNDFSADPASRALLGPP